MLLPLFLAALLLRPAGLLAETAPLTDAETRQLLEKSLSVTEIDKQIRRIDERKQQTEDKLHAKEVQLAAAEARIADSAEEAGRVLRSYYMGEKDALLRAFLSARSLSNLIMLADYFDAVFVHDQHTLNAYKSQYAKLRQERGALETEQTELAGIEKELLAQRDRVAALQADVDGALDRSGDAERLRLLIGELNRYWETAGLAEVNRYFGALAEAMGGLPDWIRSSEGMLEINGLSYTLRLPEDALNRYLRQRNKLFDVFTFRFDGGSVSARGKDDGMEIEIQGHYTVVDEPENALIFHVDDLVFNGLHLPDTTRSDLESRFDLGFYPQKIVPILKAQSVTSDRGVLTVKLAIPLGRD